MKSQTMKTIIAAILVVVASANSVNAQSLVNIHATPAEVAIGEPTSILIGFKSQGNRSSACGLLVNFGDGTSEHVRVEDRYIPVLLTHTYNKAGTLLVTAEGKGHLDGLRSVFGCFGTNQRLAITVRPKEQTQEVLTEFAVSEQTSALTTNAKGESDPPSKQEAKERVTTDSKSQTTSQFKKLQSKSIGHDTQEKRLHTKTETALPAPTSIEKSPLPKAVSKVQTPSAGRLDCALASSRIENAICASPKLSRLDARLGEIYSTVLLMHSTPVAVRAAQRTWLTETRNQCVDEICLIGVYEQRIAALITSLPKDTQNAIADAEQEDKADANFDAQELAKQKEEQATAIAKKQSDDAAAQAKKQADDAAAIEKQRAQQSVAEAAKKEADEAAFWTNVKGAVGIFAFIAMIAYAVVQRKKRNSGSQTEQDKSNDLNKSVGSILTETSTKIKEDFAAMKKADTERNSAKKAIESPKKSVETAPDRDAQSSKDGTNNQQGAQTDDIKNRNVGLAAVAIVVIALVVMCSDKNSKQSSLGVEDEYYSKASSIEVTPFIHEFRGLKFGDSPSRIPPDFLSWEKSSLHKQSENERERLDGFPPLSCYRKQSNLSSDFRELILIEANLCFDKGRLMLANVAIQNASGFERAYEAARLLMRQDGERNTVGNESYEWSRTKNGVDVKTDLIWGAPFIAYSQALNHRHPKDSDAKQSAANENGGTVASSSVAKTAEGASSNPRLESNIEMLRRARRSMANTVTCNSLKPTIDMWIQQTEAAANSARPGNVTTAGRDSTVQALSLMKRGNCISGDFSVNM